MLLRKDPSIVEVYNDTDKRVVNLFRVLRDPEAAARLRLALELTPNARAELAACQKGDPDPVEDARRLIVRSFQSVGAKADDKITGWRTRFKLRFNYQQSWNGWPEHIPAFVYRLKDVLIECQSWEQCLALYDDTDTLFYVDPPYLQSTRSSSHQKVYANELTEDDHRRLCDTLKGLSGMVVLSGYDNDLYRECLRGWHHVTKDALGQGHSKRVESLWINPAAAEKLALFEVSA